LLGLRGDAVNKIIEFSPQFPASWTRVEIENYQLGDAVFSISFVRDKHRLYCTLTSENARDYRMRFSPSLGIGTEITASRLDGQDISHQILPYQQQVQVMMTHPVAKEKHQLEIMMKNPLEVLPPVINTQTGEKNQGLRIISIVKDRNKLLVNLEGLSGRSYRLNLHQAEQLQEVQGGNFRENYIQFQMPASDSSEYIDYQLILVQKE
jgi:hypothetical protein